MPHGGRPIALALACALALATTVAACGSDDDGPAPAIVTPDGGSPDVKPVDSGKPGPLCVDGKPTGAWPPGPYELAIGSVPPPELAWDGPGGQVRLQDYYEPCAARSRLLVVRSSGAWCGPCIWHATHTTRLLGDPRHAGRLVLLDLLIADEDNMPATPAAAARWRAQIDAPAIVAAKIAVDVKYMFSIVLAAKNPLPEYVLVDTRTMKVRTALSSPDPQTLVGFFDAELASLDGKPRVDLPQVPRHDDILTDDQFDLLQDMKLPAAPPADPTNEVADLPAAVTLGKALFNDTSLSPSGTVACVTCHDPTKAFGDGLAQGKGVSVGDRNSPAIALAAHARWQFWDGRADTLWMQALGPFENAKEFASSRLFVAHAVVDRYAAEYAAVFGVKYPLPDLSATPASGKPGDAAYDALPPAKRDEIARVYVNVGKAIAAFERSIRLKPNAFDRYVGGDTTALNAAQKRSLGAFFKVGCTQCHWGPRLTNDAFHVIGFPTGRQDGVADRGRAEALLGLATSEFVASSKWSDAPGSAKPLLFTVVPPSMIGAFKTPTLRGISQSAPYGHGGNFGKLLDVAKHYGQRGDQVPTNQTTGTVEEWLSQFDGTAQADLPSILDVLTGEVEP
jgi:cytochrome c peroxidase